MTHDVLHILVPRVGTAAARWIDAGSGVVTADDLSQPFWCVHFEGNRYRAINLQTFEDRVRQAAGRLVEHYPTVACGVWPAADFEVIGTLVLEPPSLIITDLAAVACWQAHKSSDFRRLDK